MSIVNKPDYKVFAQDAKSGEIETFPDVLRGWGVTLDRTAGKPPLEWFNAIGKRVDEWLMYLSQRGLAEWDSTVDYPQYAAVQHSGKFYVALKQNISQQPDRSQNNWQLMADFLGASKSVLDALNTKQDKGDYATNSALNDVRALANTANNNANTKLAKNQNGADIPDKNAFVKNLGLVETVERANNAVPSSRKVNGKALTGDINITSQDIFDEPVTIHENADLNNYRTGGLYYQPSSAWAAAGKNYPRGAAGSLIVLRGGYTQRYCVIGSSESYIRGYYDSLGWSAWAKEYNSENPQPPDIPAGVPMPYPHRYTHGYLTCNGQSFDKSKYPQLAIAYPSGVLPDLRGEFIRGWDDGRGVDSGRGILSWQPQQVQWHRHVSGSGGYGGDFGETSSRGHNGSYHNDSQQKLPFTNNGSDFDVFTNNGAVGAETRPRNIAFNYIVRAA
ncbi:tail fiber protein [Photorhabdus laumondii]